MPQMHQKYVFVFPSLLTLMAYGIDPCAKCWICHIVISVALFVVCHHPCCAA